MAFYRCVPMTKQNGDVLPSGYRRCKYLQSSISQYIDTGIYGDASTSVSITASALNVAGGHRLFGARYATDTGNDRAIIIGTNMNRLGISYGNEWHSMGSAPSITVIDGIIYSISIKNSLWSVTVDGVKIAKKVFELQGAFTTPYTMKLFAFNDQKSDKFIAKPWKVYGLSISKNGFPILEFIPAIDTDGTPCMYDTVTRKPFYNQGTGAFGYELEDGTYVEPI